MSVQAQSSLSSDSLTALRIKSKGLSITRAWSCYHFFSTGPHPQLTPLHNLPTGHSVPQPLPHFPSLLPQTLLLFLPSTLLTVSAALSLSPGCSRPPPSYQGGCPSLSQHPDQSSNSTNLLLCLTSLRMWQDSHPPLPKCWLYSKFLPRTQFNYGPYNDGNYSKSAMTWWRQFGYSLAWNTNCTGVYN